MERAQLQQPESKGLKNKCVKPNKHAAAIRKIKIFFQPKSK